MVNAKKIIEKLLGKSEEIVDAIEKDYEQAKRDECKELYNDMVDILIKHKASVQNTLFVLKMIEWSFLRAKYVELVEGNAIIPEDSIPLRKDK